MGHTPETVTTVTNITVKAHNRLWEHTPLTLFTLLTLFKRFTLLALALCMNTLNITAWIIRSWKI